MFNKKIKKLSDEMVENSGVYRKYNDMDLTNATFIFIEVMLAKTHDKHNKKISQKGMEILVEEFGKSLRQTIKLYTGVDLHNIFKFNLSKKEKKKAEKIINNLIK